MYKVVEKRRKNGWSGGTQDSGVKVVWKVKKSEEVVGVIDYFG